MQGGANKDQYRFVQLLPDLIVDVDCMCEVDNNFQENGWSVERQEDKEFKRKRPLSLYSIPTPSKKIQKRKKGKDNNPLKY